MHNSHNAANNNVQSPALPVLLNSAQQAVASAPFPGYQSLSPPPQLSQSQVIQPNPWMSMAVNTAPFQVMLIPQPPVWAQMQQQPFTLFKFMGNT